MACDKCKYKGYEEIQTMRDANIFVTYRPCKHCDDVKRYSEKMKEMHGKPVSKKQYPKSGNVIVGPFPGPRGKKGK